MMTIMLALAIILFAFRTQVVGIFSIDPNVIAIGKMILFAQLCSTVFAALCEFFTAIFQGFGAGVQSNVMGIARGLLFIPILIVGSWLFAVNGIIWAMTIAEGLACLTGIFLWLATLKKGLPIRAFE